MPAVRTPRQRPARRASERAHLEAERAVMARRTQLGRQELAAQLLVGGQERLWERGEIRWAGEQQIKSELLT